MCGIYGVVAGKHSIYNQRLLSKALKILALLSESRGKDSAGLCFLNQKANQLNVLKGPVPINKLLKEKEVQNQISLSFGNTVTSKLAFGHARLVTNGTQLNDENNQPVIKSGIVGVHNGIITNANALWEQHTELERSYEIDTEVLLALIRRYLLDGCSIDNATSLAINKIEGTVATAFVLDDYNKFILATNNGSLYTLHNTKDILFFASELHILKTLSNKIKLTTDLDESNIKQVKPNTGLIIDYDEYSIKKFSFKGKHEPPQIHVSHSRKIINIFTIKSNKIQRSIVNDLNYLHLNPKANKEIKLLEYPFEKIKQIKRCSKCILPETFPFIEYDDQGVCNYCKNYVKTNSSKSLDNLYDLVKPFRKKDGSPDVLLPFSGGRDSTYTLHIVKEELGLNPITYTYDWGMVTDLARRNIARICGKLGVENIIIAADIHWKRENIRKNITAWLKKPSLGMIPLFMAGDKYFFYYSYKVKKYLDIDLEIWGMNRLENTDFKTGFAGLEPEYDKKWNFSLSLYNQLKLFSYVGANYLKSPGYLNQSIIDTFGSFVSRYMIPKVNFYQLFDYIQWNEEEVNSIIINKYNWEQSVDTSSTWRIGDGTASFYNYIYCSVVGFTENDTFRSNQIREGMITREQALKLIYAENKPRYNSLKWYLEIIGLDYKDTISRINKIQRLF